jgi:hypothetical protein
MSSDNFLLWPQASVIPTPVGKNSDFGETAFIGLFRGAGDLLGLSDSSSDISGMDVLYQRLQQTFPHYFFASQVFDSYTGSVFSFQEVGSQQARNFVSQLDSAAIGLVGYSAGGLSAIRTAQGLAPQPVDLLIQVDSYDPLTGRSSEDEVLPGNVLKGINYYQRANRFNPFQPGFNPTDLQGATNVQGSENINAETLFDNRSLTHRSITNYIPLQDRMLQNIETYVLQNLVFAEPGELSFAGNASLINNILKLAPGANNQPGQAVLSDFIAIDNNFSFQTQFQFRLPPAEATASGITFSIDAVPIHPYATGLSDLTIAFEPLTFSSENPTPNTVGLFTPELTPDPLALVASSLDFDAEALLTAWINYDGSTDRLQVFLNNSQAQPATPLLDVALDLSSVVGSLAQFGFQTTVGGVERQADVLTWAWTSTAAGESSAIDLIWRDAAAGQTLFWLDNGNLGQSSAELPVVPAGWNIEGLADFDQNGSCDLLWRQQNSGETVLWLMEGTVFQEEVVLPTAPPDWQIQALGDIDQNGSEDVLWRQPGTGNNLIWLMERTVPQRAEPLLSVPPGWEMSGATDIDKDGDTDLLWRNPQTRQNLFWRMAGSQPQEAIALPDVPAEWQIVGLADLDKNDSDDIFWRQPTAAQTVVWYMESAAFVESAALPSVPGNWELIV